MLRIQFKASMVCLAVTLFAFTTVDAATVSSFIGGDVGEGLDMDGNFLYGPAIGNPSADGSQAIRDATLFPLNPDAPANSFALAHWRVLSMIDIECATAFNLPNQSRVAMLSSNPAVEGVVYVEDKNGCRGYLVVIANLSHKPARATLTLDRKFLGMSGKYKATRVDSQVGIFHPHAMDDNRIDTLQLPPWCIVG